MIKFISRLFSKIERELFYSLNVFFYGNLGRNTFIKKPCMIVNKDCIYLGKNVSIWNYARIEPVTVYEGEVYNPQVIFEDSVSIQQNLHLTCADKIIIGRNTAIAANVTITDIHHPYNDINLPIRNQKLQIAPVKIGDDCNIGNNVVILKGVTIGNHVTVAANSVVVKSMPNYCVAAGIPARIIKLYNFETNKWEKSPNPRQS